MCGRISLGSATPRDLCAMLRSLNQVPAIREVLRGLDASLIEVLVENTDELPDIRDLITRAINDDPPIKLSDGDTIREGYSAELDELRSTSRNAKQIIAALEATERSRRHKQSHPFQWRVRLLHRSLESERRAPPSSMSAPDTRERRTFHHARAARLGKESARR